MDDQNHSWALRDLFRSLSLKPDIPRPVKFSRAAYNGKRTRRGKKGNAGAYTRRVAKRRRRNVIAKQSRTRNRAA